jgi:uncharacterized protein (TIGR02466 family)
MQEFTKVLPSNAAITGFFPIPVYKKHIGRALSPQEIKASDINSWSVRPGSDNVRADTTKVLASPAFFSIKKFIDDCVKEYVAEILAPTTNTSIYITQSWINFNRPGDKHHFHNHSNSIISGVFYLNTVEHDMIYFGSPERTFIHMMHTPNWWNMKRIGTTVSVGELLLFPSTLEHGVEKQLTDGHTRVSIAFNTWFKGEIGSEEGLTQLII